MKNLKIVIAITLVAFCIACGNTATDSAAEVAVKFGEKEQKFTQTSSFSYQSDTVVNKKIDGKLQEHGKPVNLTLVFSNYELDTSRLLGSIKKQTLDKPENVRVEMVVIGEEGSTRDSQIKAGEYLAANEHYMRVSLLKIYHLVDGKEEVAHLNSRDWKGKIVISSVEGKTINGEIDLTEGDVSIKGPFSVNKGAQVK